MAAISSLLRTRLIEMQLGDSILSRYNLLHLLDKGPLGDYLEISARICYPIEEEMVHIMGCLKCSLSGPPLNEGFMGDKIVVFYERKFGLCPYYNNSDPNQPINGGLPQNQTLEDHLDAIRKQIQTEIPDQNFSGLAVIDVEEFRPLYSMNWGQKTVYKKQSKKLIKAKYPNIDADQVEKEAEKAYNEAAKEFFVATITTARKLRPKAKWGYYDYPFCNTNSANADGDYECSTQAKAFNDEMSFIWDATEALFPSIYLSEGFMGDKIVVFYERKFGLCPYYNNSDPNQPINGGLPQNQTLEDHLDAIKKQIQTEIPDQNFSGLAVIDVEEFRPLYSMNWGQKTVYKKQSMELIKAKNPNIDQEQVEKEAEKAYNEAAKKFFVATITTARKLRPNAKWGYYDYPFCNTNSANAEGDYECSTQAKAFNDEMSFIWDAIEALFPSIYLNGKKTSSQNFRFIQVEAKRVANRVETQQKRRVDIYAYSKFEYDPYTNHTSFYEEDDFCNTVKQCADLGISGVVLWSTSKQLKQRCSLIADFMGKKLGPYILNVRNRFEQCREERCTGKGNCILRKPMKE
ncbi:hyaluronoglucosaminidase [Ancylostoma ceylanicum]|uniref:Hyaluronidase n=1 Tax=Ancylostoma ceylanicum TaxID=53326 RepID=A0A0D6LQA9_9BILA|nr:hyaluronoglucosaminidase [Ancylostoma ceylanicum]